MYMSFGGVGRCDMYRLKSVGERTPPWTTPNLILRCLDLLLRKCTCACLFWK